MDLNIKAKTIKFLEVNIGANLCDLGLGKALLSVTPKITKEKKLSDLRFIRILQKFHASNDIIKKPNAISRIGENIGKLGIC